jgi:cytochrome P450
MVSCKNTAYLRSFYADDTIVSFETLRLCPAVPNGVQRTPPPHGGPVPVAGHVVPVGTTVQIPTWSREYLFTIIP